ncbi:DUF4249 domain-containing protein [Hymenobacter sp. BT188]|uniref:DUF4249 domain-containing protein n=1 Tax=Hymenobacter sp. BT188 TaxID=2763504 RepID=UPI001651A986|nr:DUF4249 domain-containing protein [Hymenobacter sp. BT188]MBC6608152.1 DUF4249 domain-containing protein [Hymenobacter sp. BT188]
MALLSNKGQMSRLIGLKYWLPALVMTLTGCETIVELELPEPEPLLAINSVINPDSVFSVDVSASQSLFAGQAYAPIENAIVEVYQGGQFIGNLQQVSNGRYRSTERPQPLQPYELRVSAPGYPSASATTELPASPELSEISATKVPSLDSDFTIVEASFVLADDPAQENFYYIQAYTPDIDRFNKNKPYNRSVSINLLSPFEAEFSMETRSFFSDRLFNGQSLRLQFRLENSADKTTYVRVARISKAYYEYVRALKKQSYGDNVLTSPGPVANNIQSGLGLFGSYSASVIAVKP